MCQSFCLQQRCFNVEMGALSTNNGSVMAIMIVEIILMNICVVCNYNYKSNDVTNKLDNNCCNYQMNLKYIPIGQCPQYKL